MKLIELKPPVKYKYTNRFHFDEGRLWKKFRITEVGKIGFILKLKQVYFNHILLHYNWHYPIISRI